jgi:hypothetical protein
MRKPTSTAPPSIELLEPEDGLFMAYANHLQIGFTASDVRIIFGELIDFSKSKATVEQRAQITLAWLQAKVLRHMLDETIAGYEKINGEIKVPQGLLDMTLR